MDNQQKFFTHMVATLREEGYTVYDCGVPGPEATYPYILMSNIQQVDAPTKSRYMANVYPQIDVYHNNVYERGVVSDIMLRIKQICQEFAINNGWLLSSVSTQIRPDDTTTVRMLHGIVEPNLRF